VHADRRLRRDVRLERRPHRFRRLDQQFEEVRGRHELARAERRRHRRGRRTAQDHVDLRVASSTGQEGALLGAMLRDSIQERLVSPRYIRCWLQL